MAERERVWRCGVCGKTCPDGQVGRYPQEFYSASDHRERDGYAVWHEPCVDGTLNAHGDWQGQGRCE